MASDLEFDLVGRFVALYPARYKIRSLISHNPTPISMGKAQLLGTMDGGQEGRGTGLVGPTRGILPPADLDELLDV